MNRDPEGGVLTYNFNIRTVDSTDPSVPFTSLLQLPSVVPVLYTSTLPTGLIYISAVAIDQVYDFF